MDRRRFLLHGGALAAFAAVGGHGMTALAAHAGEAGDVASRRPSHPPRPFGAHLIPYATPERMADKIALVESIPRVTHHWRSLVRRFRDLDRVGQMEAVNALVNKLPYVTDDKLYGRLDLWDDPLRFFGQGGDCEEFALAKYALLWHLGFHPERMQVLAVTRLSDMTGHAVLGVSMAGNTYILDQTCDRVVTDDNCTDYRLVYTLCSRGVHVPA